MRSQFYMKSLVNLITLNLKCSFSMKLTKIFLYKHSVEQHLKIMIHFVDELHHQMRLNSFSVIIKRNFLLSIRFIKNCSTRCWIIAWLFFRWMWLFGVRYFNLFISFTNLSGICERLFIWSHNFRYHTLCRTKQRRVIIYVWW